MRVAKPLSQLAMLVFCWYCLAATVSAQDQFQLQRTIVELEAPQLPLQGSGYQLTSSRLTSLENTSSSQATNTQSSVSPKFSVAKYTGPLSQANQLFSSAKSEPTFQSSATVLTSNDREQVDSLVVPWEDRIYTWSAPHFYHRQLYFEQVNLERYGIGPAPIARPIQSSLHFYGSIVLWPVKMIVYHPSEREYSLGHQRPGDMAAYQH